jgi:hypothetical protein
METTTATMTSSEEFQPQRGLPVADGPQPEGHDQGHREHRLHHRDRRHRQGRHLRCGAEHGGGLAQHPPTPPHQEAQAQSAGRRAQVRRLVLQNRTHREQHRRQGREQ